MRSPVRALPISRRHFRIRDRDVKRGVQAQRRRGSREIVYAELIEDRAPHLPLVCCRPLVHQRLLTRCGGLKSPAKLVEFYLNISRFERLRRRHVDCRSGFEEYRLPVAWI